MARCYNAHILKRSLISIFIAGILIILGLTFEWNHRSTIAQSVPIITYHDVVAEGGYSIAAVRRSSIVFAQDIEQLAQEGYTPIKFSDLIAYAKFRRLALPAKPIVIAFDDGWVGQFNNARPILESHGFVATFFINSALIGSKDGYMSWNQVRALRAANMEIGGHGTHHIELAEQLAVTTLHKEISRDKERIEAELGVPINTFAYPYNTHTTTTISVLKAVGYDGARTGGAPLTTSLFTFRSWIMENK